jgi:phage baseplate assembly protein gpV
MKDLVPKGTGNSRFLKSVSNFASLYPNYEDFVAALVAGTLPIDLNGINSEGVKQVGTALNKSTLLDDTTAEALEMTSTDPTVNEALYILSQKSQPAEVHVLASSGQTVTMTLGSKTLTAVAGSDGWALLYPAQFGDWTVKAGSTSKTLTIDSIAVYYVSMATLESLSWSQVAAVSKSGMASKMWNIGDKKTLTVNGVTYTAVIIGFDHDNVTDANSYGRSKAGITWQLETCLASTYPMNSSNTNSGGWTSSVMRSTTMKTLLSQLTSELQSAIVPVNKLTSAGSQSTTINTTSDSLFLLSEIEIYGATNYSKAGEGTQYEWYEAGNSKVKTVNGSAFHWWERSPSGSNTTTFCAVDSNGGAGGNVAGASYGVSFGFCV